MADDGNLPITSITVMKIPFPYVHNGAPLKFHHSTVHLKCYQSPLVLELLVVCCKFGIILRTAEAE